MEPTFNERLSIDLYGSAYTRVTRNADGSETRVVLDARTVPWARCEPGNLIHPDAEDKESAETLFCAGAHDCLKSANHSEVRGTFCTVCDRHILHAEFT